MVITPITIYLRRITYPLILDAILCSSILNCRKMWDRVQSFCHVMNKLPKKHEIPRTILMEINQPDISGQEREHTTSRDSESHGKMIEEEWWK